MPNKSGVSTRMVALNFFNCINRTQLQHFLHEVEGSKKKLRKQSLKINSNKIKLQFLISPNNLNSLFVLLMVTQTLVHRIFSKGKSPQLARAHFTNVFLIFCTFPPKVLS